MTDEMACPQATRRTMSNGGKIVRNGYLEFGREKSDGIYLELYRKGKFK